MLSPDWASMDGVWIGNQIYCSLIQLITIQITIGHTRSSQPSVSLAVVALWWIPTMSSASVLTFLPAGDCLTTNSLLQMSTPNWLSLTVMFITFRHGSHRKHRFLLLFPVVAVQTCLFACLVVVAQQRVYMSQYYISVQHLPLNIKHIKKAASSLCTS
jgi:hypothetical protein